VGVGAVGVGSECKVNQAVHQWERVLSPRAPAALCSMELVWGRLELLGMAHYAACPCALTSSDAFLELEDMRPEVHS